MSALERFINRKRRTFRGTDTIAISPKQRKAAVPLLIILLVVLGAFVGHRIYSGVVKYDGYSVEQSLEIDDGAGNQYVAFEDFFIKYGLDGISYINGSNNIWSQSYQMTNPIVDVCENYAAVADKGTNTIYVFNESGLKGQVATSYPIISIEVANQGVVAALLEEKNANYIEVYDKDGERLISHKTLLNGNGYPLSFSLSDDGKKMAVSYVCVSNGTIESKMLFYNFSEVGQNSVDRMVGGFNDYNSTVIPMVRFLTNDVVVAIGDNVLTFYKMKEKPSVIKRIEIADEIQKVFYNRSYVGLVFNEVNGGGTYKIQAYNLNGGLAMNETVDTGFEKIAFTGKNVIIYDDLSCRIIAFDGRERFETHFKEAVVEMIPTDKFREYLMITNNNVRKIKIK